MIRTTIYDSLRILIMTLRELENILEPSLYCKILQWRACWIHTESLSLAEPSSKSWVVAQLILLPEASCSCSSSSKSALSSSAVRKGAPIFPKNRFVANWISEMARWLDGECDKRRRLRTSRHESIVSKLFRVNQLSTRGLDRRLTIAHIELIDTKMWRVISSWNKC